jgi:hypothetical protein
MGGLGRMTKDEKNTDDHQIAAQRRLAMTKKNQKYERIPDCHASLAMTE